MTAQKQDNASELIPILLVEDDTIDVEVVRRTFVKFQLGNQLHIAADGVEALEILGGKLNRNLQQPCLILLDINMPRMDGIEFLRKLRGDEALRQNIVFVLTTSDRNEDKTAAYDLCVAGYVLKEKLDKLAETLAIYCGMNSVPERTPAGMRVFGS